MTFWTHMSGSIEAQFAAAACLMIVEVRM